MAGDGNAGNARRDSRPPAGPFVRLPQRRQPRSSGLPLAGSCLLLALLAGCGGAAEPPGAGQAGELVVGAGADASPSGAFQARLGVYPLNVGVAETLTRLTRDYRVEPLLATRWEHREGNTWRFWLRRGVRFHDGQALDARAVQSAIAQVVRGGFGYSSLSESSVEIVDDHTVDITTTRLNLRLPEQLVHPNYSVFAPGSDPALEPVGTGPFRFVAYRPGEAIVVRRNAAYWGEDALLRGITFRFYPDATTRVLALLAGEVDLVIDVPREQVGAVAARKDLKVVRAPVGQTLNLHVNAHGPPPYDLLADVRLRRAVALAIDRRGLVQRVWSGEAEAVQNMTVPAVLGPFANRVEGFGHDPREAARLLEAAGWPRGQDGVRRKGGRRLEIVLLANPEIDSGAVEFVQAQLRRIGIDARWVKLPDVGSYAARLDAGEFDLNLTTPNQNDANPLFLPALIFHSESDRPFARWHRVGERFDRIVEAGLAASDPAEARRRAAEAMHVAIDEEAVVIPIAALFRIYAMRETVEGFVPHPSRTNQSWTSVHLGG